jgi:lysophospholipid acyltransferase (LPLAT)-like uncharacterized protein
MKSYKCFEKCLRYILANYTVNSFHHSKQIEQQNCTFEVGRADEKKKFSSQNAVIVFFWHGRLL